MSIHSSYRSLISFRKIIYSRIKFMVWVRLMWHASNRAGGYLFVFGQPWEILEYEYYIFIKNELSISLFFTIIFANYLFIRLCISLFIINNYQHMVSSRGDPRGRKHFGREIRKKVQVGPYFPLFRLHCLSRRVKRTCTPYY